VLLAWLVSSVTVSSVTALYKIRYAKAAVAVAVDVAAVVAAVDQSNSTKVKW
jgi:hypothetical protein